jgi:hypothetical protein
MTTLTIPTTTSLHQILFALTTKVKGKKELDGEDLKLVVMGALYSAAAKGKLTHTFWPEIGEYRYPSSGTDQARENEVEIPQFYDGRLFLSGQAKRIHETLLSLGIKICMGRGFDDEAKPGEARFPVYISASWEVAVK